MTIPPKTDNMHSGGSTPDLNEPIFLIMHDSFRSASEDALLFAPAGVSIYADRDAVTTQDLDPCGDYSQLTDLPLLSPQGEQFLFLKMNYLRYLAEQHRISFLKDKQADHCSNMMDLLADADSVRNHIAECNIRLVISIARRFATSDADFDELMSEGSEILLKAITKFDVSRGFRFSTYATYSVQRHYYRLTQKMRRRNKFELRAASDVLTETASPETDAELESWIQNEQRMTDLVARMAATLDERECRVIAGRFGLQDGVTRTLRELASELGLSKERVRQLQIAAVDKLRDLFDELDVSAAAV